ncbi:MAG: hypothetical protein VX747_02775, partial [Actinomycetota bacterium]|nr:hypothetical protein [Actinomycetota bacterium]
MKTDRGHAVDVDRIKLPPAGTAATLPLREYLEDPAVLAAYDDPATLERPAASPLYDPPAQDVGPRRASSRPAVDRASAAVDPFYLLTQDDDDASFACADADAVPAGAAAWALPGVPFAGRPCHRVAPADERRFLEALDTAGMLAAVWDPSPGAEPDCGFFAVRKEFRDGVWWQRLILDRRRRNAFECYVPMPPCPHGTVLCDLLVDAGCELRVWCSDLPQFYYRMEVSAARAATNTFTGARRTGLACGQFSGSSPTATGRSCLRAGSASASARWRWATGTPRRSRSTATAACSSAPALRPLRRGSTTAASCPPAPCTRTCTTTT